MKSKLHRETIEHILEVVREDIAYHNDKINIMDFYGYDDNQEDGNEFVFGYSGDETPTREVWALAKLYMRLKQDYEYDTYGTVSFGMDIKED